VVPKRTVRTFEFWIKDGMRLVDHDHRSPFAYVGCNTFSSDRYLFSCQHDITTWNERGI